MDKMLKLLRGMKKDGEVLNFAVRRNKINELP